jgi:acyl-CoA synthetase (NDP forming)
MVLSGQPLPAGGRVAILTNAGGPGILAADACEAHGLELPALSPATTTGLRAFLPREAAVANPVDMIASASGDDYERALSLLLADDAVDSVIVIFVPPMVTKGGAVAGAVKRAAAARPEKPVLAVFMSSEPAPDLLAPIPAFAFPEAACAALARIARYVAWRRTPEEPVSPPLAVDLPAARRILAGVLARGGGWAGADEAQRLLAAAGIDIARGEEVTSEDEAVAAAARLGYPVVLKAVGPTIVHKTEAGGIRLNLADADAVRTAWRELRRVLPERMTAALVQPMVSGGVEMLVGCVEDPAFGPVVACALGGVTTEVLADTTFRLAPLGRADAERMIDGLRSAPLLRGFRGAPVADEAALRDALLRLSALVTACPEIQEIEINPLRVLPAGVRALDARVRIEEPKPPAATRRIKY